MRHHLVAIDQFAGIVGDGREHRRDQFRIGRQRDVFLGAGMDGGDRGAGVGADAAGDDRHRDALGFEPQHQVADVERDVDHHEIGAAAGAQHVERLIDVARVGDAGAAIHRDLGRGGELALQGPDDQETHGSILSVRVAREPRAPRINSAPP